MFGYGLFHWFVLSFSEGTETIIYYEGNFGGDLKGNVDRIIPQKEGFSSFFEAVLQLRYRKSFNLFTSS